MAKAIQSHLPTNGGKVHKEKRVFFKDDCGGIVEHEGGYAVCRICGDNECA